MAPLDQRDRDLLERYKASLSPTEAVAQDSWEAIVERVEHEPLPRSRARAVWIGVAVAAALVVGSLVVFHAAKRLREDDEGFRVQSVDRAVALEMAKAFAVAPAEEVAVERAAAVVPGARAGAEPAVAAEPVAGVDAAAEAEPSTLGPEASSPAAAEPASSARPPEPRRKRAAPATPRAAPAPSSVAEDATSIQAELELLASARAALEREDFPRVLALVQRYDRDFSRGMMREELELLRVGALCEVGPKARWTAARSRFEREFPGSPLAAHLREDCFP